jgi:hypothetical protein
MYNRKQIAICYYFLKGESECVILSFSNTHALQHLDHLYTVTTVPNVASIIAQSLNPGELTYSQPELDPRDTFIVVCRALARPINIASHVNMHFIGAIIMACVVCATLDILAKACFLQLTTNSLIVGCHGAVNAVGAINIYLIVTLSVGS